MEYIYFVVSIAAIGLVINYFWKKSDSGRNSKSITLARQQKGGVEMNPVPRRKNTITGASKLELEHIEFQNKIDIWQKGHEARRANFTQSAESLSGQSYKYNPAHKTGVSATGG